MRECLGKLLASRPARLNISAAEEYQHASGLWGIDGFGPSEKQSGFARGKYDMSTEWPKSPRDDTNQQTGKLE
ncbi:hypothetical protein TMES_00100 [Thalassospira mesophila]|uniref:Uncharacterized protein n=1 Tax=Thalassospira mesophila TaxID=1293891 RepID=A0A1Y2L3A9_9PROT|nr:hypothetical protein TMES_00100 [Thalassospira mesophila]